MSAFLLSVHVLAAILTIGPVAIAASMFPPAARAALTNPEDVRAAAVVRVLHRISRVYGTISILVPVFGVAVAATLGVLGNAWLIASMILTAVAAGLLVGVILPAQRLALARIDAATSAEKTSNEEASTTETFGDEHPASGAGSATKALTMRLGMSTGLFNLCWAVVTVLMIYRPGSTTGVGL